MIFTESLCVAKFSLMCRYILVSVIPGDQLLNHYTFYYKVKKMSISYLKDEAVYRIWLVPSHSVMLIIRKMQMLPFLWELLSKNNLNNLSI